MKNTITNENGNSALIATTHKGGRATKYGPETVDRLLAALADGLTQKQACIASGICENTLAAWREKHPELEPRLAQAREQARQKALAVIKTAANNGDWRAAAEFLRLSFQNDYRQTNTKVEVNTNAQAAGIVCTEEQRQRIIALREQLENEHHPD